MNPIDSPYVLILIGADAMCASIAAYVWLKHRNYSETIPLVLLLLGITEWVAATLGGMLDPDLSRKMLWAQIEYIGVVSVPLMVLVYVLRHSGSRRPLTARQLVGLALIPAATLVLAWTNGNRGLIWARYVPYLENGLAFSDKTYGPGFWIYWAYSYLLLLAATAITVRAIMQSARLFRWQNILILIGILAPWIGNLLYVLHLDPLNNFDLTPLAFGITGIALAFGMFRWRLFDIKPVAQAAVIAGMADGVMILDAQSRIVEMNPAAQAILGLDAQMSVGKPVEQVLAFRLPAGEQFPRMEEKTVEIKLTRGGETRDYELSNSPFHEEQGSLGGRLIFLRDVTDRKHLETKLRDAERIRAETLLAQSENQYTILFHNMSVGVIYQSADGNVIDMNPAAERILGMERARIGDLASIRANIKTIHEDGSDFPAEEHPGMVALKTGKPLRNQVMGVFFPGEKNYHWIIIHAVPQFKPGEDTPYQVFLTIDDVTERKRAEQALSLVSDTQNQIARLENLADIYQLVGEKIQALIGDGYVAVSMLDERIQALKVIGLFGFGDLYKNLVRKFKVDPSRIVYPLKDMTDEELRLFRSGKLEKIEGGLYAILTRKVPKSICGLIEQQLKITGIYTIGFVWQELHFGGLTVLAKRDIAPCQEIVETMMNLASISLNRIRAENALRESEEKFKYVFDNSVVGKSITRLSGEMHANKALCEMLGYSPEELHNKKWQEITHPDDIDLTQKEINSLHSGEKASVRFAKRYIHKNGSIVWGDVSTSLRRDGQGKPLYLMTTLVDISENKLAEQKINHLNRALQTVSAANQTIVRATDEAGLLSGVCKTVVELGGYRMAWVGYAEEDPARSVRPVAHCGIEAGYLDFVNIVWSDTEFGRGPTGRAIRTERTVVAQNLLDEKEYEPWCSQALQRGYAASIAIPLSFDGKCQGALNIYAAEPQAFDSEEIQLLEELAQDLAFGISAQRGLVARRQAEEANIRLAQEWQTTFDSTNSAIWILDRDQRILQSNKTAERFFRRPGREFIGKHCWEIVHGSTQPIPECPILRMKNSLHRESMELKIGEGWFEVSVDPILDAAGGLTGAVHIVSDITARMHAEEALRDSEARLRAILDATPFPVALVDIQDEKIDFWSRSALSLFGHTAPTASEWYEIAYPDPDYRREVIARWKPALEKARQSPQAIHTGEYRVTCGDGSVRICELYAGFLSDKLIVTFHDVTENKRMEDALRASETNFRTLAENAGEGVLIAGAGGVHLFANRAAAEITGYSVDALLHLNAKNLAHPDEAPKIMERLQKRLAGENPPARYETAIVSRQGVKIPVEINSNKTIWKGRPADIVFLVDITERKRIEESLKSTLNDLERSNTELEQFAYIASHDLQEPLRMVSSYTQLLAQRYKGKLDSDADEFIGYAVDGASHMQRLINDLLSYSRVGTRGKPPEPVAADRALDRALENLKFAVEEGKARVTREPLPIVTVDDVQLSQVFQNLIANAIKFRGEESPRIRIAAEAREKEWVFSVRDNGIGIDPQYLERIFIIFQRLNPRGKYPGTGIGLAMCQKIILRHGGRIWAESKPGEGSTFFFTLPRLGGK